MSTSFRKINLSEADLEKNPVHLVKPPDKAEEKEVSNKKDTSGVSDKASDIKGVDDSVKKPPGLPVNSEQTENDNLGNEDVPDSDEDVKGDSEDSDSDSDAYDEVGVDLSEWYYPDPGYKWLIYK